MYRVSNHVIPFLVFAALPSQAHHSSAPHFDRDTEIVLEAVVTEFRFVNPHSYVYFDVVNDAGETVAWRCELSAANLARRNGWTPETLSPGDRITINGAPARREENVCFLNSFTTEQGLEIRRSADLVELGIGGADEFVVFAALAEDRPRNLANGDPNISGDWVRFRPMTGGGAVPPIEFGDEGLPNRPTSNEAGQRAAESWDYRFDNPALFCRNANIIHGWQHDAHANRIVQGDETITLYYGYNDLVRTIHLGLAEHPQDLTPSTEGHSIGHWEGDTLVVDTVGFSSNAMIPIQEILHSDQMHIVERFRIDYESERLIRSYVVEDPWFTSAYASQDLMAPSAKPLEPYNCVELAGENNIRPE